MRAFVEIIGALAAAVVLALTASSCDSSAPAASCVAGRERCACSEGECDEGLTCISMLCFDLGDLGSQQSASTQAPQRNPATRRPVDSGGAGGSRAGTGNSGRADAGASMGKAGTGARPADAGARAGAAASSAADSGRGEAAAGADGAACAAPGTSCASTICCQGSSCISNTCRIACLGNSDCSSHCCVPFDATRSACADTAQCTAANGGSGGVGRSGGSGGVGRSGGSGGSGGRNPGDAGSCSAAGAECGTQGCCDGVSCVNNVCAAACSSEQDCASSCCLSFFAGAEKVCVPQTLCRGR